MTNTHVNVGGHKITTNKVGQQHEISVSSSVSTHYNLIYVVTNGVCIISSYFDKIIPIASFTTVATGLPPTKMTVTQSNINSYSPGNPIILRVTNNGSGVGELLLINGGSVNTSLYFTMTYPVADDWVES